MPDPLRIAFIAAECEPWAKTGGLGDVVDALARALPSVPGAVDGLVDVFLPRYRSVAVPSRYAIGIARANSTAGRLTMKSSAW